MTSICHCWQEIKDFLNQLDYSKYQYIYYQKSTANLKSGSNLTFKTFDLQTYYSQLDWEQTSYKTNIRNSCKHTEHKQEFVQLHGIQRERIALWIEDFKGCLKSWEIKAIDEKAQKAHVFNLKSNWIAS